MRRYTRGIALVNPDPAEAQRFALGGSYRLAGRAAGLGRDARSHERPRPRCRSGAAILDRFARAGADESARAPSRARQWTSAALSPADAFIQLSQLTSRKIIR